MKLSIPIIYRIDQMRGEHMIETPKEIRLMALLRDNARLPLTLVSRTTRIPVSTIFDTLKELNGNVIRKYTAIVDFKQLGYEVRLHLFFKLAPEERDIFQDFLEQSSHINTAHRI